MTRSIDKVEFSPIAQGFSQEGAMYVLDRLIRQHPILLQPMLRYAQDQGFHRHEELVVECLKAGGTITVKEDSHIPGWERPELNFPIKVPE